MLMTRARQADRWDHTSELLAMIFNCHMDTGKSGVKSGRDFHPDSLSGKRPAAKKETMIGVLDRDGLYDLFINGKMPSHVENPQ